MTPGAALVTGAAKRIGRALALDLAARGWSVAIHYNGSREEAEATAAECTQAGAPKAVAVQADLTNEAATQALLPAAVAALDQPLTLLVNNASIFEYDSLRKSSRAIWDRNIESNLRAPFVLIGHFAAQAPKAETDVNGEQVARAAVVNIIDQRVWKLTPHFSSYTLAKAGLWALTQTAAQGLAPDIRVNAIGPGTTLPATRQTKENFDAQRANCILERGASPEELCAAMRFLLDAPSVTGQMIAVDGGQHLAWRTPDIIGEG